MLEVGCGVGRDAIPLAKFITSGSYVGVDIIKPSIEWCQANVANDRVSFLHFNIRDKLHNPGGNVAVRKTRFPVPDGSIDRVFLFSVFTHMYSDDIVHYLREFHRVLKPDGLIYASTFVYDDKILETARATNLTVYDLRFEHQIEKGCRINNLEQPLGAIAFTLEKWDKMIAAANLEQTKPVVRGSWSGVVANPVEGQDVLILAKSKSPDRKPWYRRAAESLGFSSN
jgi:SAM-dependent methyltransferase